VDLTDQNGSSVCNTTLAEIVMDEVPFSTFDTIILCPCWLDLVLLGKQK
jgi:hypothetical protein